MSLNNAQLPISQETRSQVQNSRNEALMIKDIAEG
jgi:hypothetical protein